MTGVCLRVEREGKWGPVEVEHLTSCERRAYLMRGDREEVMRWMDIVCVTLVNAEQLLQKAVKETNQ